MEIRRAVASDRNEIVELYLKSQAATGIPNPTFNPPDELGQKLYNRHAIERFVAIEAGRIVGHGLIQEPNPDNIDSWLSRSVDKNIRIIELGAGFVDPDYTKLGIWTALLIHRLNYVDEGFDSVPVSATWDKNKHIINSFRQFGGYDVELKAVPEGMLRLFVFEI